MSEQVAIIVGISFAVLTILLSGDILRLVSHIILMGFLLFSILQSRISHVYIGSSDPNPLVAGKGVKILRENGIEVTEGVLKDECDELNEIFFHYITAKKPFVTMKYAMTMDGKIACYTGESKWITGEEARINVHKDRLKHSAIMVGIGFSASSRASFIYFS